MKKYIVTFSMLLACSIAYPQLKIESALNNNEWPSREDIQITFEDSLLNKTHVKVSLKV